MSILPGFICALLLALLVLPLRAKSADAASFDTSRYYNSPPDGPPYMEVQSKGKARKVQRFVPLRESRLSGSIEGPLAALSLSQKYSFTKAQSARPIEALYRFPLPGDAAVKGVIVRFGGVEIETSLKERGEARAEYDAARSEGRQAAFVSRESGNSFTMSITGIEPDVTVEVLVNFVAVARPMESGWELRFPLTLPPRYVRADEAGTPQAGSNPLALAIDPGHRFSMDLKIRDARDVASSTHEIAVKDETGVSTATLAKGVVTPDRDLLLSWKPDVGQETGGLFYAEEDGEEGEDTYFLLLAAAGQGGEDSQRLKREVTLLIDHSGSMEGAKWAAADWAAKKFLSDLEEGDFFDVAFFHNDVHLFSKKMLEANPKNVAKAIEFVMKNRSSGGTELGKALEQMLMIPKAEPKENIGNIENIEKIARQLLVITDAQVTDEGRILELARREYESDSKRRISVLCIDASPNDTLTNRLAERGGGTAVYLTSQPDAEDVTTAVDEILSRWSRPVAEKVILEVAAQTLHVAGRTKAASDEHDRDDRNGRVEAELGSLMGGEPLWIVGKISGIGKGEPVRVRFDERHVDVAISPVAAEGKQRKQAKQAKEKRGAIRTLYGARQIQELEFLKNSRLSGEELRNELLSLGYETHDERSKVYEENNDVSARDVVDELLLTESLKYGIVSTRTAFVASRTEKGKHVGDTLLTPNALPSGWDDGWDDDASTFYESGIPSGFFGRPMMVMPASAPPVGAMMGRPFRRSSSRAMGASMDDAGAGDGAEPEKTSIYDSEVTVPGAGEAALGEVVLKEITGSGRLSGLGLSEESLKSLGGENLSKLFIHVYIRIYIDGNVRSSAAVKLSDLVKLGGERPLNLVYGKSVRFVLSNESDKA
ncbi:MAG: VWA domain-containing protein, partial [Synergistaceae bacterium]|nr:VWA domain-containing protein [Synergistaceae bacterium]